MLAAMAGAKQFSVFHFSPRYTGEEQRLREEAYLAYERQRKDGKAIHFKINKGKIG